MSVSIPLRNDPGAPSRQPSTQPPTRTGPSLPPEEPIWLEPLPDEQLADEAANPEACYLLQESITLAFLVVLHLLPLRQRAVLILCEVLDWRASEVAHLLALTAPAVNSMLHCARTTLAKHSRALWPAA